MNEVILINGDFYTQDADHPRATAVAIRGGRFYAVGDDDHILTLGCQGVPVIDLGGRCALPGFTDAHFHLCAWALGRKRLSLAGTPSLMALKHRLQQRVSAAATGDWILGQGWNETDWPEARLPNRDDLDGVASDHPVLLWRADMHLAVANSAALIRAGIGERTENPEEGVIDRDLAGRPTGVLREAAVSLVADAVSPPSRSDLLAALRDGLSHLQRKGLTGLHAFPGGGAGFRREMGALQRWVSEERPGLRLWALMPGDCLDAAIELGLRIGIGDDWLALGQLKYFADGAQGSRTAWLLESYEDDAESCGMPLTPVAELSAAAERADRAGLAVAIHAIGDRANREVIDLLERVISTRPKDLSPPPAPHRVEHAQLLHPEDVPRLARLGQRGVVPSMQPLHATDDMTMVERSIGGRASRAYVLRSLMRADAPLAFGSDAPVAACDPWWGIHAAVTRRRRDGAPEGGWHPSQQLTVSQAVWGYTMGPAIASGRSGRLGSIAPGKLADLQVVNLDPLTVDPMALADCEVEMTIVGGRVVHRSF